jgi:hypothetical protein
MSEERLTEILHRDTPEPPNSIDLPRMARQIADGQTARPRRWFLPGPEGPRRRLVPALIAAAAIAAIALATATVVSHRADQPEPAGGGPRPTGHQLDRAKDALEGWDKAIGGSAYIPIRPSTGGGSSNPATWQFEQVGNWPGMTGRPTPDSAAMALRLIAEQAPLSKTRPPAGRVVWAGGDSTSVQLLSPAETLQQLRAGADICVGCKPGEIDGVKASTLVISKVTLTTMQVQTTRGPATVPAYRFSFVGKAVQALQAAIAPPTVKRLPADDQFAVSIETVSPDRQTLTLHFTGVPGPASRPCGADYSAFAVESGQAVAIVVTVKPHGGNENCTGVGAEREAAVQLTEPLAARAVLDTASGTAVRVTG